MKARGLGRVYKVSRSIFTGHLSTPFLCNIKVGMPDLELHEKYREKRRKIIKTRRKEYLEEIMRR